MDNRKRNNKSSLKKGVFFIQESSSHRIYKNLEKKRVTVPFHMGKILHPKTLKSILNQADITLDDLKEKAESDLPWANYFKEVANEFIFFLKKLLNLLEDSLYFLHKVHD